MRALLQRVTHAEVSVLREDGWCSNGRIGAGLVVFLGVGESDNAQTCEKLVDKIMRLRMFADDQGKTNLSLSDVGGGLLLVSQFTLYADCRRGNRPSFTQAGPASLGEALFSQCKKLFQERVVEMAWGEFGAEMRVDLCNDGPFTLWLDTDAG